jgi:hypothetical protein
VSHLCQPVHYYQYGVIVCVVYFFVGRSVIQSIEILRLKDNQAPAGGNKALSVMTCSLCRTDNANVSGTPATKSVAAHCAESW